jgi:membrane protein DedA with SNARE-associated domain
VIDLGYLWPYLTTFGALVAAGVGVPIPEELPVVLSGAWAAHPDVVEKYGAFRWLILPVCILGVVIADGLLYGVGRKFGTRLLETRFFARLVPPAKRTEIEENFHKHGVKVLLFARFLPGIRSPIFIMAGVMRLPLSRFLLADGIYAIPGVSMLFFLSWWFGDTFIDLIQSFEHGVSSYVKPLLILLALGGVIGYLLYKFLRHPVSTGNPPPLVETLTHVPGIKQVTQIVEGKSSITHRLPAPCDNHHPAQQGAAPGEPQATVPTDQPGGAAPGPHSGA